MKLDSLWKNYEESSKKWRKRVGIWSNRRKFRRKAPKRSEKEEKFGTLRRKFGEKVQKGVRKRKNLEQ